MRPERVYTGIGLFVFGAMLLLVSGSLFLYNQYLHGKIETYVMFFKGSLNGLEMKSAVTYRGVKIGEVKRIELTANKSNSNVALPVYVEFFVEKSFVQRNNPIQILIDNGIKASITSPNLLTGVASIELNEGDKKTNPTVRKTFHGTLTFPTETANEDEAIANDTFKAARKTLKDVSAFIRSKELKAAIKSIDNMANSIDTLSNSLDKKVPGVAELIKETLAQWIKTGYTTQNLTDYLSRHPESLIRGKS